MIDHIIAAELQKSLAFIQAGHGDKALLILNSVVQLAPNHSDIHFLLGLSHAMCQQHAEAIAHFDVVIRSSPSNFGAYINKGIALRKAGDAMAAIDCLDRAIRIAPEIAEAHCAKGNALADLGLDDLAVESFLESIKLNQNNPDAFNNLGAVYARQEFYENALNAYTQSIRLEPSNPDAYNNLGNLYEKLKRYIEAITAYSRAIELMPDFSGAYNNLGVVYLQLKLYDQALESISRSLALTPNYSDAYNNLGRLFFAQKKYDQAFIAYNKSLEIKPDSADALGNLGILYDDRKRFPDAVRSYENALILKPDSHWLSGAMMHARMKICDWEGFYKSVAEMRTKIGRGFKSSMPFPVLSFISDLTHQKACAEIYVSSEWPGINTKLDLPIYSHPKIRIAYISCDFKGHAIAYLMAGVFESHDRERFEIYGFDTDVDSQEGPVRARLLHTFDQFFEVGELRTEDVVELIKAHEIDVLVDLTGHTKGQRTDILAYKPAPIQVNYLGYPGTMGASYIDYIIGDATLIPKEYQHGYTEKIAYLPDCFQANDSQREIAPPQSRSNFGIEEGAFVFGCFNQCVKFTPDVFSVWLSILKQVPNALLWLIEENDLQVENLRKFTEQNGVSPDRLVFTGKLPYAEHLARYALMDLALDTMPFNGGTTTSDALWGGVPVLTCIGETFAGRMAASLLNAIGLPELITKSLKEYETLAVELGTNPNRLTAMRHKLAVNRLTMPLFDTQRFTRNLENAYEQMIQRHQQGFAPDHLYMQPI